MLWIYLYSYEIVGINSALDARNFDQANVNNTPPINSTVEFKSPAEPNEISWILYISKSIFYIFYIFFPFLGDVNHCSRNVRINQKCKQGNKKDEIGQNIITWKFYINHSLKLFRRD